MRNVRASFVVPPEEKDETLEVYLERVFKHYETYKNIFVGDTSQGHSQVLELDSAGSYTVAIKPEHRVTYLTLIASPGSYVFNINLSDISTQDNKDGDIVQIYMKQLQPGAAPTIRILDQDLALLYEKVFSGAADDSEFKQFVTYQSQWNS